MSKLNSYEKTAELIKNIVPDTRYDFRGDFLQWQEKARKKLSELLGLDSFDKCDLDFKIEFVKETNKYIETRFIFQSEKDYYVPCHLRVPIGANKPLPIVICLQGHSTGMHISLGVPKYKNDEESIKGGDRAFAERIIEEGFCALALEQRYMGECGGDENGPRCYIPSMANLLIGRTAIGERVWDVQRAIDVLEKYFPQADSKRIMCMGNSGGGTTAYYASCIDERISAAMPSCSVCSYDASIAAMSHCSCNFIPGIRKHFDMCDLGGLIAPRVFVMVNGAEDVIFPIDSACETADFIRKLYKSIHAEDKFAFVVGSAGHRFYADDAWPVMRKVLKTYW